MFSHIDVIFDEIDEDGSGDLTMNELLPFLTGRHVGYVYESSTGQLSKMTCFESDAFSVLLLQLQLVQEVCNPNRPQSGREWRWRRRSIRVSSHHGELDFPQEVRIFTFDPRCDAGALLFRWTTDGSSAA